MNTNRFDIILLELESDVNNKIVSFLDDKYSQSKDSTTLSVLHQNPTQYEMTITLEDVNYDEITDNDKSVINELIQEVLEPYKNKYLTNIMVSNICFSKNTPILTDQGVIKIQDINTAIHTIGYKSICHITKSISTFKHLVCFEKDSLGKNRPTTRTVVSECHKIYHYGRFISAVDLSYKYTNVHLVPYYGEILFNILMKKPEKVLVNNMICETLHPDNIAAKNYNKNNDYENYVELITPNTSMIQKKKSLKLMKFSKKSIH